MVRAIRSFVSGNTIVPRQGRIGWVLVVLLFQVISFQGVAYEIFPHMCVGAISKADGLRVREKPSAKSKAIAVLNRGEFVKTLEKDEKVQTIDDKNDCWYRVRKSPDVVGWVFGGYLDVLGSDRFYSAMEREDFATLSLMIKYGFDVNLYLGGGPPSAFAWACDPPDDNKKGSSNASVRVVDFLIKNGGNVNEGCLKGYECFPPPLVSAKNPEIIRKLIDAGSTPEVKMAALESELDPYHFYVGQKEKVKILLDEGHVPLAPCAPGERGYCLEDLFFAFGGDPEMIAYTIEKGANVNFKLPGGGEHPTCSLCIKTIQRPWTYLLNMGPRLKG